MTSPAGPDSGNPAAALSRRWLVRHDGRGVERREDAVAVEGALEIRVDGPSLAVTLRTPGDDPDLVLGFLFAEAAIERPADVASLRLVPSSCADESDLAEVRLAAGVALDWTRFERRFAATSACGLCGRAHLESLRSRVGRPPGRPPVRVRAEALLSLPGRMVELQAGFRETGGLHAAAWMADNGEVAVIREDVGRHNAVDKVVGALLTAGRAPAEAGVLWVSGRAGAELVLKAARAGIPVLAAVGAPTSLAVDLAEAAGMVLVAFLREGRMNVYAGGAAVIT